MLCRVCNSDAHLIQNFPKIANASFVNFMLESSEAATSLTISELLDTAQNLSDDVCQNIYDQISEPGFNPETTEP